MSVTSDFSSLELNSLLSINILTIKRNINLIKGKAFLEFTNVTSLILENPLIEIEIDAFRSERLVELTIGTDLNISEEILNNLIYDKYILSVNSLILKNSISKLDSTFISAFSKLNAIDIPCDKGDFLNYFDFKMITSIKLSPGITNCASLPNILSKYLSLNSLDCSGNLDLTFSLQQLKRDFNYLNIEFTHAYGNTLNSILAKTFLFNHTCISSDKIVKLDTCKCEWIESQYCPSYCDNSNNNCLDCSRIPFKDLCNKSSSCKWCNNNETCNFCIPKNFSCDDSICPSCISYNNKKSCESNNCHWCSEASYCSETCSTECEYLTADYCKGNCKWCPSKQICYGPDSPLHCYVCMYYSYENCPVGCDCSLKKKGNFLLFIILPIISFIFILIIIYLLYKHFKKRISNSSNTYFIQFDDEYELEPKYNTLYESAFPGDISQYLECSKDSISFSDSFLSINEMYTDSVTIKNISNIPLSLELFVTGIREKHYISLNLHHLL